MELIETVGRPPRVRLAQLPTPLEHAERLSELWGGPRIWIKRDDLLAEIRKRVAAVGERVRPHAQKLLRYEPATTTTD